MVPLLVCTDQDHLFTRASETFPRTPFLEFGHRRPTNQSSKKNKKVQQLDATLEGGVAAAIHEVAYTLYARISHHNPFNGRSLF